MKKITLLVLCTISSLAVFSAINKDVEKRILANQGKKPLSARAGDCVRGSATINLEVNNVRALLLNSGDLWWDRSVGAYEVPKRSKQQVDNGDPSLKPLFAGAIWISGKVGGNLRMAAVRYSSAGQAFWPGPVKQGVDALSQDQCNKFDNFWSVTSEEINAAITSDGKNISNAIYDWPGRGNPHLIAKGTFTADDLSEPLAPFYDADGDCIYNPDNGDLPSIKMASVNSTCTSPCKFTFADQMIFWVINDVGNNHTNPSTTPIGVQMNCLAFAFKSSDELNDMTFYTYEVFNKSNVTLGETYMSQYMDADLGNYNDDYVGCDSNRSLGFIYNADAQDENGGNNVNGYLDQPPIFGADFFEGPKRNGAQIGLSSFLYYVNSSGLVNSDPQTETEYRNYQEGKNRIGQPLTKTPTCYAAGGTPTKYCFYGDPSKPGEWSMCDDGFAARDLRWVQNSGPFDMISGSSETITIGCIFVRPPAGTQQTCRPRMKDLYEADDKAQRLFDFCFEKAPGPDAPDIKIIETSNKLYFRLENSRASNNYGEGYDLKNIDVPLSSWNDDTTYTFEGYMVYQVLSENAVSNLNDLKDESKAKLIRIMDRKNGITKAVNFKEETINGRLVAKIDQELDLPNNGIEPEFSVENDLFEFEGQKGLINNKTYYYATVAFAYNNYANPNPGFEQDYQRNQLYFSNAIRIFKGTPHDNNIWGVETMADYYDEIPVKRIAGQGHGRYFLDLDPASNDESDIVANGSKSELSYLGGKSPFLVKVVDPFKLKNADFKLTIKDSSENSSSNDLFVFDSTYWELEIKDDKGTRYAYSEGRLDRSFSQSLYAEVNGQLESYGISIAQTLADTISFVHRSGAPFYGYVGASMTFEDSTKKWLTLLKDNNNESYEDWNRSGSAKDDKGVYEGSYNLIGGVRRFTDSTGEFSNILEGRFAPYCLTANVVIENTIDPENTYQSFSPGFKWNRLTTDSLQNLTWGEGPENNLDSIFSVDFVITKDREKWSRCLVFETGESPIFNEGGAMKGQLRQADGVNKFGITDGSAKGLSWFPGYAINLETGVRVNVYYGENSRFRDKNGANMLWDPGSLTKTVLGTPIMGGSQFIYIMNTAYDDGLTAETDAKFLDDRFNLTTGSGVNRRLDEEVAGFYRKIAWTCVPLMTEGDYSFYKDNNGTDEYYIESDVRIKVRVAKPYKKYDGESESIYTFNTQGKAPQLDQSSLVQEAYNKTTLVPNPYYAFSAYESNATQNTVKIVNIPRSSDPKKITTISIYTTDGMLVRKMKLDGSSIVDGYYGENSQNINYDNSVEWDLRTSTGILVGSGVYYVNIESPDFGSKVLKLFAVMRSADVSNF